MSDYLSYYEKTAPQNLYTGIGGVMRRMLDRMAQQKGQKNRHALFIPRIFELCGKEARDILELGCGNGLAISYKGPNYYAVDLADNFAEELRRTGVQFFAGDLSKDPIPLASGAVDMVLMNHIIEHLPDPDMIAAEVKRVLRPGGFAYIRTPDIIAQGHGFWNDYTHIRPFTERSLNHLMEAHGFQPVRMMRSNHALINLDILTGGRLRTLICNRILGGTELEALYQKPHQSA